jgi:hypothetical protein
MRKRNIKTYEQYALQVSENDFKLAENRYELGRTDIVYRNI